MVGIKRIKGFSEKYFFTIFLILVFSVSASAQKKKSLSVTLRGVYESKISLLPLTGKDALKPVFVIDSIRYGETANFQISEDILPGEFVLRIDYKEDKSSVPYPAEKLIIMNDQDIDLMIHPLHSNNPDSTWFQKQERENSAYSQFLLENDKWKASLGLLQNFLLNYDDTESDFYKSGIEEYELRRNNYNKWLRIQTEKNSKLFVSKMFGFEYVPEISWSGSDQDRNMSLREHYFEGMDLQDPMLVKTSKMKQWMDKYVNLYGTLATTVEMRDSLFTVAGRTAIEKAKMGDPLVYGWMVDYFFNGFESFNIKEGIAMLESYVNDPACPAAKKEAIKLRISGIRTLISGALAPNIRVKTSDNRLFDLYNYRTITKYILLVFWSADCIHCKEMLTSLEKLYSDGIVKRKLDIVAISLDEAETEKEAWKKRISELPDWTHILAPDGIVSEVVTDYYILGIPVMVLLSSETKTIEYLPDSVDELNTFLIDN